MWTGEPNFNTIGREVVMKLSVVVLPTVVALKGTNSTFELRFHIRSEVSEFRENFKFIS